MDNNDTLGAEWDTLAQHMQNDRRLASTLACEMKVPPNDTMPIFTSSTPATAALLLIIKQHSGAALPRQVSLALTRMGRADLVRYVPGAPAELVSASAAAGVLVPIMPPEQARRSVAALARLAPDGDVGAADVDRALAGAMEAAEMAYYEQLRDDLVSMIEQASRAVAKKPAASSSSAAAPRPALAPTDWAPETVDVDELQCKICLQNKLDCTLGPCAHTLCGACFNTALAAAPAALTCPFCREPVTGRARMRL